jgi:DNA-binding NtrC family response regulator
MVGVKLDLVMETIMPIRTVLIAHSNPEVVKALQSALVGRGVGSDHVSDITALKELTNHQTITDLFVENRQLLSNISPLIEKIRDRIQTDRIIVISKDSSSRAAINAVKAGAFDYLSEPIDPEHLEECLDNLLEAAGEKEIGDVMAKDPKRFDHIIGQSQAIRQVFRLVDKVAATDSTVMIYGESGTGKELIARAIHQNSYRRGKPLIPVNCGAIPEELLESELFGHEKGAFTSAIRTRLGRFEMADNGTIFLDEIADMSPKLQVKVLRVLQEHQFERIGGTKTIDVNIRVITATNKDLRQAMEEGRFREDLFYRLNVIPVNVPPLRERKEDIPLLVDHFLTTFTQIRPSPINGLTPEAMEKLQGYSWPGNVRELENIIERMVILAENEKITVDDLPHRIGNAPMPTKQKSVEITEAGIDFNRVVSDFEDQLLLQALEKTDWVKNKAARLLNLNRTTLVEKLKKKDISSPA